MCALKLKICLDNMLKIKKLICTDFFLFISKKIQLFVSYNILHTVFLKFYLSFSNSLNTQKEGLWQNRS